MFRKRWGVLCTPPERLGLAPSTVKFRWRWVARLYMKGVRQDPLLRTARWELIDLRGHPMTEGTP